MWKCQVLFLLVCTSCVFGQQNCTTLTSDAIDEQQTQDVVKSVVSALIEGLNTSQIVESFATIFNETLSQVLQAEVPLPTALVVTVIVQTFFEDPVLRDAIFTEIIEDPQLFPDLVSAVVEKVDLSCTELVIDIVLQAINDIIVEIPPQILVLDPSGLTFRIVSNLLQGFASGNEMVIDVLDKLSGSLMGQGDPLSLLGLGNDQVASIAANILVALQNASELSDGQSLGDLVAGVSEGIINATQP